MAKSSGFSSLYLRWKRIAWDVNLEIAYLDYIVDGTSLAEQFELFSGCRCLPRIGTQQLIWHVPPLESLVPPEDASLLVSNVQHLELLTGGTNELLMAHGVPLYFNNPDYDLSYECICSRLTFDEVSVTWSDFQAISNACSEDADGQMEYISFCRRAA